VVIKGLEKVVPSVVRAVLDGEAEPVYGAVVVLIDTYAGNAGAEVDFEVVNGLFRSLTAAICQTRLRSKDCIGMRMRVNGCLRTRFPVRRVGTPAGEMADTADNLLAYFSLLHSAEPAAAACLMRADDGPQWRKAHSPRRLRGLIGRTVEAHRPGGQVWHEQEPADELLNGGDMSEDVASDGGDCMKDVTDDEEAGAGGSARDGGDDGGGGSAGGDSGGSIPGRAGDRGARGSEDADRAEDRSHDDKGEVERHARQISGRGHGRRRDRGSVDDELHVHAGRDGDACYGGSGRAAGARVDAAVRGDDQDPARDHGQRRDRGTIGDEVHVLEGRDGDARYGGDGRAVGARVDAAVHGDDQDLARDHGRRRDRGTVDHELHVHAGRDGNTRNEGDCRVGGARVDAAVHGNVQVAASAQGRRRDRGTVEDESHVHAGRDGNTRDGGDGRAVGAHVDAAVHGDDQDPARDHGRRRDRGTVDDESHVHAGRDGNTRHEGHGRVGGARVDAAVHSNVQHAASAQGRRRDRGTVDDELHVHAGRDGNTRNKGRGLIGGARVDATVHGNVQVAASAQGRRGDRGPVDDEVHVHAGRDGNTRDGGDGCVGGARFDAAVHSNVQVAASAQGRRRDRGTVDDEVHVHAGRVGDARYGGDGRAVGARVDAAVHGDDQDPARDHGRRRDRGTVDDALHMHEGRDGDAREKGHGRVGGARVDAAVHSNVQFSASAQGRRRDRGLCNDELHVHAGRDGDARDGADGRARGARVDAAMPDDAEVAARAQGQRRDRGDVVDSSQVQQRPDSNDGDGRGGGAVFACRDAGGGDVDDDRQVATRAHGRRRDRGAVVDESHAPAGTRVDAASSAVDGKREVAAVDGDGRVGARAQDRRRAGAVVVDGHHVKRGHDADTRDGAGGRDVGARADAVVDGDGHLAARTNDLRLDGGVVVDGVQVHRGQDAAARDGVGGGLVDSRVDAAAHGDRHVVALARDRRHREGAAGDVRQVATDVAAGDDRDDDGGSGCDVGGGQLGGDLSLFSGVSASRHDDPLSSLDAEDLRLISEALSSTCFRGEPGRSGSSYVPCNDEAMQLGPVSYNATTQKHCADHVKGTPEVSRRRETTAERREGANKHDVDAAREVHAPSTGSHMPMRGVARQQHITTKGRRLPRRLGARHDMSWSSTQHLLPN